MSDAPQGAVRRRCPVCEQVMAEAVCPRDRMATLLVDAPVHAAPALTRGEVLAGRYEILEPIGQGGYGHVYRARHLGTGQDVAVKLLRVPAEEDGAFAVQRFFLEARVTSGLTHPNTVRVFDFGQDDAGRVFLVMELLFGRTLREELRVRKARGQRFSDPEVVQIGAAITRSLAEAHEQGLVHRDLKPDNVFLHQVAGDDPVVKVLDFGIAKLGTGHRHTLSSDTSVPGTPAYMSPEHAF
ncbi:MAG: serine/threonine protein kinase, partial [Myxococcales bacterium]|nr:serine/threonine protein kinase [Myxococcales bacterium]